MHEFTDIWLRLGSASVDNIAALYFLNGQSVRKSRTKTQPTPEPVPNMKGIISRCRQNFTLENSQARVLMPHPILTLHGLHMCNRDQR